ncbi:SusC/RagA family TonB-linked outer membrane protein [Bacteroides sp. UBA939]|uniref:SusC/RagA family TonB-linked outer membrane protein n=1 Tax=Bacteroides sp. UBA939 TaxID=1946092 RepID=UPI0025B7C8C7|nr:TonB-dependent receptor [Bacteroides sp. UBA939]
MKKKEHELKSLLLRLFLVIFCAGFMANVQAQNITQTGVVLDQLGEPMIGVTVQVKGTATGAITNIDGNFSISCSSGNTLVFSFMGYKTVEHKATGQKLKIEMAEDAQALEEVVIVGFGTVPKAHITGSTSSVDAKALEEKSPVSVFDALQGAAPGMQITSSSGAPGASAFVSVRGASTFSDAGVAPLYVVDGVIVESIDDISPSDIKQIDIMKDAASAAIYGARSANGVVLITTKSGESGKPRVDVRYQHSFYNAARKLPQVNAFESRLSMAATDLANPSKTLEKFSARTDSVGLQYSTNYFYQDLLFRTGSRDDANVQISGGSKGFVYRVSLNYLGQKGIMLTSYNDTYTANLNVDYEPWKNIKFTTRVRLSHNKKNNIKEAVFQDAMRRDPDMIIWYPDGELIPYYSSGGRRNPIAELEQKLDENSRYTGSFYQGLAWTFTPWLRLDANISANYESTRRLQFSSKYLEGSDNGKNTGADLNEQKWKYAGEAYFNFNKEFGDHSVSAMLGTSFETSNQLAYKIGGSYFISEDIHYMNLATIKDLPNVYTTGWDESTVGFFGRAVYSWKSRYILTALIRQDGSSRFGVNSRWGTFPSVSAAWRFSDEPFMHWASDILTDAKLRASYGITGNDKIGRYESQTTYVSGAQSYNGVGGVVPNSKYGNPDLKWEETKQTNVGLDLSFLGGRIMFVADYYVKQTSDLLADQNLPYTTGYNNMRVNLASIENRGLELSVTAVPIRTRDFNWSTTINWWTNKNKITDLAREDYITGGAWMVAKGHAAGLWYGYENLGVYQYNASNAWTEDYSTRLIPVFERDDNGNVIIGLNGQPTLIKYTTPDGNDYTGVVGQMKANGVIVGGGDVIWYNKPDENGKYDNEINTNDQKILGDANPDWYGSWSNSFTYKDFSLSMNFYASWGGQIWNDLKRYYSSWGGNTHKQTPEYVIQGWKYPGEITSWYALDSRQRQTNNHTMSLSNQFLEDATFIRLANVRLSYNVNKNILNKTPMRSVQVYVYGNNLVTWTNYSGFDPELQWSVLTPGKDSSKYPRNREVGFGFNVGF